MPPDMPSDSPAPRRWTPKQRLIIAAARWLAPPLIVALGNTLDLDLPQGLPPEAAADPPHPAIYAFWHRQLLPFAWYLRHRGFGIMVSRNFDGEWIARAAQRLGFLTFRGSSTRGGREALLEMADALRAGAAVGFTVDGPRGPRFQAKPGPVYLARMTGFPLYAIHVEMPQAWEMRSWDRLQIPKPGSPITSTWSGPFFVPANSTPEQMEAHRAALEGELNRLRFAAASSSAADHGEK